MQPFRNNDTFPSVTVTLANQRIYGTTMMPMCYNTRRNKTMHETLTKQSNLEINHKS